MSDVCNAGTLYPTDPWSRNGFQVGSQHAARIDTCSDDGDFNSGDMKRCYTKYDGGYALYTDYSKCQDSMILLPGFNLLPEWQLQVVYFVALVFCFFGVAIVSDTFMSAIEVITSKKKKTTKFLSKTGEKVEIEVKVWNPTIANLTLLALGSSAPEILLSLIETIMNFVPSCSGNLKPGDCGCERQDPGELGASTIVGSAAFNLLAISAVCMLSVPKGEIRRIEEFSVFLVTAIFSVMAYIWLLVVYAYWTPDKVTIVEAWITFALFPILVGLAYATDRGFWLRSKENDDMYTQNKRDSFMILTEAQITEIRSGRASSIKVDRDLTKKEITKFVKSRGKDSITSANMTQELIQRTLASAVEEDHSRLHYRINATKQLGGKMRLVRRPAGCFQIHPLDLTEIQTADNHDVANNVTEIDHSIAAFKDNKAPVFGFRSTKYTVLENAGFVKLIVLRAGLDDRTVTVKYQTRDGTANDGSDYKAVSGLLKFPPHVKLLPIEVPIVDDNEYEPDENFFVTLSEASENGIILAEECEVTIIDDDEPGVLGFSKRVYEVPDSESFLTVDVLRKKGSDGKVTVDYSVEPDTAIPGEDFVAEKGTLVYEHGESSKSIVVRLVQGTKAEPDKCIDIKLSNPTGGALIIRSNCVVSIVDDERVNEVLDKVTIALEKRLEVENVITNSWLEQFKAAVSLESSIDEDGEEVKPEVSDCIFHYISITWKVIFAAIPPTDYCNGWATFWVSLLMIGLLTFVVGELASLFGCAVGLNTVVTAITFVALGTSLPDTFASREAALGSSTADAAIGNVTGSNSVNVFLGLGMPWVMATAYYKATRDEDLVVNSKGLDFSVTVFSVFAVVCLSGIVFRRCYVGGELGGSEFGRKLTAAAFFFMWVLYIILSSLKTYEHID